MLYTTRFLFLLGGLLVLVGLGNKGSGTYWVEAEAECNKWTCQNPKSGGYWCGSWYKDGQCTFSCDLTGSKQEIDKVCITIPDSPLACQGKNDNIPTYCQGVIVLSLDDNGKTCYVQNATCLKTLGP
jgi:hypothetical protein